MNKEIAHLFWHGELTNLEKICIQSFVKQGFDTKIWSYTNIQVDGAESCDARLILPEEHLTKYKQQHFKITDDSKEFYTSMAAFSDVFRWHLINKFGGWWFDTDCYCLKSSEEFKKLRENKPFVAGLQNSSNLSVNTAAIYADYDISLKFCNQIKAVCECYNYNLPQWGDIGPNLLTKFVQEQNLIDNVVSIEKIYSIETHQFNFFTDAKLKQKAKSLIVNSYISHIWHSQLSAHNVDKNNPPDGSLLKEFYDGSYTNTELENSVVISNYKNLFERTLFEKYVSISELYKKILKRKPDSEGLKHYLNSNKSIEEIKNIFLNSEEYKNLK
jgi:hypothetical protein